MANRNCSAASNPQRFGRMAEDLAMRYLQRRKLTLLERNFRSRFGEIDLIMRENDTIIFIEVRARKTDAFLHPVETIDYRKRNRIRKTGQSYMQKTAAWDRFDMRFDIVTLVGGGARDMEIDWIKAAF